MSDERANSFVTWISAILKFEMQNEDTFLSEKKIKHVLQTSYWITILVLDTIVMYIMYLVIKEIV